MKFTKLQIHKAVADPNWQKVRISMKGLTTQEKLDVCEVYYTAHAPNQTEKHEIDIRIDNYLKALCRGGQLYAGTGLDEAIDSDWALKIRKG